MSALARLRIGTRGSELARAQTQFVITALQAAHPGLACEVVVISTQGDRLTDRPFAAIGSRGIFAHDIEAALLDGDVDVAVHSLKDLETKPRSGLAIAAIPLRADPRDALVSPRGHTLETLPARCRVGTSSVRRSALLRHLRPDAMIEPVRGNVPTRLRKAAEQGFDALILACAGLDRLGRGDAITQRLDPALFLPEAGQGAIAVQVRADDRAVRGLAAAIDDPDAAACTAAERACAAALEGSCQTPIAALARREGGTLRLDALVCDPEGKQVLRRQATGPVREPEALGRRLAAELLDAGAAELVRA